MNEDFITNSLPPPQATYPIQAEKSPELKKIEQDQEREDYNLAALKDHPGWQQIRKLMEKDVEDFRMLKNIDASKYTNAELGEVVRTEHMVASKLQSYLNRIDEAVKAITTNGKT